MARFDHERLKVYQQAIRFVGWSSQLLRRSGGSAASHSQLDRAALSVPLNIAEGNGKSSRRDRSRFFEIARGSALECAACLDVLVARGDIKADESAEGKQILVEIVSMLYGLIDHGSDHLREEEANYFASEEIETTQGR